MQANDVGGAVARYQAQLNEGLFVIQRCNDCDKYVFYPRVVCPHCGGASLAWVQPKGTGAVYSTTTVRRKPEAGGDYDRCWRRRMRCRAFDEMELEHLDQHATGEQEMAMIVCGSPATVRQRLEMHWRDEVRQPADDDAFRLATGISDAPPYGTFCTRSVAGTSGFEITIRTKSAGMSAVTGDKTCWQARY